MKKDFIYIGIAVLVICVIGIVTYYFMNDAGYFEKSTSLTNTGMVGTVLITVLKYLWDKIVQLFYLVISITIGVFVIAGFGIIFFS